MSAIDQEKIVILTGAGISAESGLQTFRDSGGLWHNYAIEDVATASAWKSNPQRVLNFYNERREQAENAEPNEAHRALAQLESKFNVVIVTQNVDGLHERAGSSNVIHLHGELSKARSCKHPELIYDISGKRIEIGDSCEKGFQLRPHIVWFGETIENAEYAIQQVKSAAKVLVVGTSLAVYPAAGMLKKASFHAEKLIVSLDIEKRPYGYRWIRGKASNLVPHIVDCWLQGRKVR
jgi:NAD-dependent deacetylase